MKKILTMAGAVVAIVVLAASFAPSAEAMKVTAKDSDKGIKVRCGVIHQETLRCDFQSRFGIDTLVATLPDGGGETIPLNCNGSVREDLPVLGAGGLFSYLITDCSGALIEVWVFVDNNHIEWISIA